MLLAKVVIGLAVVAMAALALSTAGLLLVSLSSIN